MSGMRVDKWLWVARFYKTRSLAAQAIANNRIRVDGQKIKPSRIVEIGDTVSLEKPPYLFVVTVLGLHSQRRPAAEAQLLYVESADSIVARQELAQRLRADRMVHQGLAGEGRPSKKQRRQIIRFQNRNDAE